ncbi:unnamed protein product [Brassicogethes aeneus]|uniref:Regucalcin n=1 Tax=Brassicogethes aeneus TaxID=1431903 RepID=A0A9P0B2C9_BRAAE|nr:unnamed protein product [Brassicogethes aeneus]
MIAKYILFGLLTILIVEARKPKGCISIKSVTKPIQHAEGPHWDSHKQLLYYVDTFKADALKWDPKTNEVTMFHIDDRNSIGIIVPIKGDPKGFVAGADRIVYQIKWDGKENNTAKYEEILMVDESKPNNQFNDGKADAKGRLWIGTLTRNPDQSVKDNGGELFVITDKKLLKDNQQVNYTSISNGLAWSKNNKHFYYIDSAKRNVVIYEFDLEKGVLGESRVLFDLAKYPDIPTSGIPDGMTIDSDDNIWVAIYGGGCILHVHGQTGELLLKLDLPVTYVTSLAFGGPNLDILYATTSRMRLTEAQIPSQPLAGTVLAITNLGVKGLPANEFEADEWKKQSC